MPSFFAPSVRAFKRCSAGLRLMSANKVSTLTSAERSSAPRNQLVTTKNNQPFLTRLFIKSMRCTLALAFRIFCLLQRAPNFFRREGQRLHPRAGAPRHRVGHRGRDRNNSAFAQTFGAIWSRTVRVFDQDRFELVG